MKKQKVLASVKTRGRKVIKASRSPQDLIDAFESKIKELEVTSCDNIMSSEEVTASDVVFITDSDKDIWYDDLEGLFGGEDGMVSLADLKLYWNSAKDGDPSLAYYDDFQSWLRDSVDNGYLSLIDSEAYELVGSTDIFDEVTEGELNSKEHVGMCEITSSEDEEVEGCDISGSCVNCSIELDDAEKEELFDIIDKYNTSNPVSGKWSLETMDEMQTIANHFGITLDEAKDIMINYLGFDEDALLSDTEGGSWFALKDLGGNTFTEHFANAEDALEFADKYDYELVGPADSETF